MADHDNSYKRLFSEPAMVRDLLTEFVQEEWVDQLDLDSLEKVSGSYVSGDLRDREDDIIWRVRWGEGWLYVYLLIEFQRTVDRYMAVRIWRSGKRCSSGWESGCRHPNMPRFGGRSRSGSHAS